MNLYDIIPGQHILGPTGVLWEVKHVSCTAAVCWSERCGWGRFDQTALERFELIQDVEVEA